MIRIRSLDGHSILTPFNPGLRSSFVFSIVTLGAVLIAAMSIASAAQTASSATATTAALVPEDLAMDKPATASSQQAEDLSPSAANDGDPATRWCASNDSFPQWWQVDLGKPQDLTGCQVLWEHAEGDYRHKIEGSADAKSWSMLLDHTRTPVTERSERETFSAKGVRYVRITVVGAATGHWASLSNVEIFGTRMVNPASRRPRSRISDPAKIAASLKAPAGFHLSVFASPPEVAYPTAVAAAPTGEVFVAIDEDGSLGKEPNRGRVLRLIDSKGTGRADQITVFAKMDHPRGLIWDDGVLYVLHPPFLTAYYDDNGDGVAHRSEVILRGISTEKMVASRGADHTTNGIRLGIDGWIYIAMGDFGAFHCVSKDGTEAQFRGGGVVRVRPDGTGLERYNWGQRNIYDVAIDPFMNVYTRDNTNDGDNWNDRLSYIVPSGQYGYPSLFMHFPGEFVDALADYGGGAPCGSIFIDEPNLPGGLYTVEWGRSEVDRHPLTPNGANFKAGIERFMNLPRGTGIDVDGCQRLYICSWANGGFSYSGPNVGYLVQLTRIGAKPEPFPNLKTATDEELIGYLASPSAKCRQAAQRQILRRGDKSTFDRGLEQLAASDKPLAARVAAIFTLKLLRGPAANTTLEDLSRRPELREFALRALADRKGDNDVPSKPYLDALTDPNPRVRLIAAWGLARLDRADAAQAIVPLLGDSDFLVSHVAVRSLTFLRAYDACLKAIDPGTPKLIPGALQVLQSLHETQVVDGLAQRLAKIKDPAIRAEVYGACCRLYFDEAKWDGSWWSTRPDTSGPYYQTATWAGTDRVEQVLVPALKDEPPAVVRALVLSLVKHKIDFPEASAAIAKLADSDATFRAEMVSLLSSLNRLNRAQVGVLRTVALAQGDDVDLRAKAIRGLEQNANAPGANDALVDALSHVWGMEKIDGDLKSVLDEFIRDPRHSRSLNRVEALTASGTPAKRELGYAILVNLATQRIGRANTREAAGRLVDQAWSDPACSVSLLHAIGRMRADAFADRIAALQKDAHPEVAKAASDAARQLGLDKPTASTGPLIESMSFESVVAQATKIKGNPQHGAELFVKQGCVVCHTTSSKQPPKGPLLAGIAARYTRPELIESILRPSAKIAQGFDTQAFKMRSGEVVEGFVSRESGDEIEVRNATGVATVLKKSDIQARARRAYSIMPEGLAAKLTPGDLADLLSYLESLKSN